MQTQDNVAQTYNNAAKTYADKFINELNEKHFDRIFLKAFIDENIYKGNWIDLGCGPGQTTRFIADNGVTAITGVDLSAQMVQTAQDLHPGIKFTVGDMLQLNFADNEFCAVIAFYAIVHFTEEQVKQAFLEINRVLARHGQFLFSFHIGTDVLHFDEFLGHPANIDFYMHNFNHIIQILQETGFVVIDAIQRQPYEAVEHPTQRAYIWVQKSE